MPIALCDEASQSIGVDAGRVVSSERHILNRPERHELIGERNRCPRGEGADANVLVLAEAEEMRDRLANGGDPQRLPRFGLDQANQPRIRGRLVRQRSRSPVAIGLPTKSPTSAAAAPSAAGKRARPSRRPRSAPTSECVPDANFDRVRGILVSRQDPRQPIALVVLEQQDLIVARAAQIAGERQVRRDPRCACRW